VKALLRKRKGKQGQLKKEGIQKSPSTSNVLSQGTLKQITKKSAEREKKQGGQGKRGL